MVAAVGAAAAEPRLLSAAVADCEADPAALPAAVASLRGPRRDALQPPLKAVRCPLPGGKGAVVADEDVIEAYVSEVGGLIGKQVTAGPQPALVAEPVPKLPGQGKAPTVLEAWKGDLQGWGRQRFRPEARPQRGSGHLRQHGVIRRRRAFGPKQQSGHRGPP